MQKKFVDRIAKKRQEKNISFKNMPSDIRGKENKSSKVNKLISLAEKEIDSKKRLQILRKALKIKQPSFLLLSRIATCYLDLKDYIHYISFIQKSMTINPHGPVDYYTLAKAFLNVQQYDEALEVALKFYNQRRDETALVLVAEILRKGKKHLEALAVVEHLPESFWRRHVINAYCFLSIGDINKAFLALQKAEEKYSPEENVNFDSRLRIYNGYIFVAEELKKRNISNFLYQEKLSQKLTEAVSFVENFDQEVGIFQETDRANALKIINELGISRAECC